MAKKKDEHKEKEAKHEAHKETKHSVHHAAKKEEVHHEEKPEHPEHAEHHAHHKEESHYSLLTFALLGLVILIIAFNAVTISGLSVSGSAAGGDLKLAGGSIEEALAAVMPTGVPAVYGAELGISFDDVSASNPQLTQATINKMAVYENQITLSEDLQQRYIETTLQISCEYCCGAESIIFKNGQAACGCAHSAAMRGLAKYLLQNHPEMTNNQILEELGKWKTLFFPGNIASKALILKEKGIELNYINLASNKYRGIEKGTVQSGGQMVGGC